jgi:hypothetical protein
MKYQEAEFNFLQSLSLAGVLSADKKAFGADRSRLIRLILRAKAGWYIGWTSDLTEVSYLVVKAYDDMLEFGLGLYGVKGRRRQEDASEGTQQNWERPC